MGRVDLDGKPVRGVKELHEQGGLGKPDLPDPGAEAEAASPQIRATGLGSNRLTGLA